MKIIELVFFILLITSCIQRDVKSIPTIDLQSPDNSREIKLSELLDNIQVIILETRDSILLGPNTYYLISNKHIISIDQDKILQFSNDGVFKRILVKAGKGPDEFLRAEAFTLDDKNDILLINHRGDSRNIISYNLTNGQRIKRISTGVDNLISQIIITGDSTLTIVPRMNKEYNFYYLTTSGNFISGFAPPKAKNIGLETSIVLVNNLLFYMPKEYDTLYLVNKNSCTPYCFFNIENRFSYDNNEIGNFVYLSANASGFMIANKVHARIILNSDGETFSMNADKQTRYFVSKRDFSVYEITGFNNDFLGIKENLDQWNNYLSITNDFGYVCYSSFELKQLIKETLISDKIDDQVKKRISDLNMQINENDNPILIVGNLKKISQ
jgi:hypothetical protein